MAATRTWVSGVGDDANPGSRTAPCKTFPGAISKTAARGEIDALDPGGFGSVTITKSITIDGGIGPGLGGILATGTFGVIINAAATDTVTLRNLSINGAGTGIAGVRILSAGIVIIESCAIFGFRAATGADAGRGIRDGRPGGGKLFVTNCMVWDCSDAAIVVAPPSGAPPIQATIDNVRLLGNANGLIASFGSLVTISRSTISGNSAAGVKAQEPAGSIGNTEINVENCVIANNNIGVSLDAGSPTVRLSDSMVTGCPTGIFVLGGAIETYKNNKIGGNVTGNALPAGSVTIALQ